MEKRRAKKASVCRGYLLVSSVCVCVTEWTRSCVRATGVLFCRGAADEGMLARQGSRALC